MAGNDMFASVQKYFEGLGLPSNSIVVVMVLFLVGVLIRKVAMGIIGYTASPLLLVLLLVAAYKMKQSRNKRQQVQSGVATTQSELAAKARQQAQLAALKAQSNLHTLAPNGTQRTGDSFSGPISRPAGTMFPGDQEWFKRNSLSEINTSDSTDGSAPRQLRNRGTKATGGRLSSTTFEMTHQGGDTGAGVGAGPGAGAGAGAGAGVGAPAIVTTTTKRPAEPAQVPSNVKVTKGGRRLYMGRSRGQLKRRQNKRAKARAPPRAGERGSAPPAPGYAAAAEPQVTVAEAPTQVAAPAAQPATPPWTSVPDMLTDLKLEEYQEAFANEALVDVSVLVGMAKDPASFRAGLREVGVAKLGHREKIVQAITPFAQP